MIYTLLFLFQTKTRYKRTQWRVFSYFTMWFFIFLSKKKRKKSFSSCCWNGMRFSRISNGFCLTQGLSDVATNIRHPLDEFIRKSLLQIRGREMEWGFRTVQSWIDEAQFKNLAACLSTSIEIQLFIYFCWWWNCFDVCAFVSFCFLFFCLLLFYAFGSASFSSIESSSREMKEQYCSLRAVMFCRSNINIVISFTIGTHKFFIFPEITCKDKQKYMWLGFALQYLPSVCCALCFFWLWNFHEV